MYLKVILLMNIIDLNNYDLIRIYNYMTFLKKLLEYLEDFNKCSKLLNK